MLVVVASFAQLQTGTVLEIEELSILLHSSLFFERHLSFNGFFCWLQSLLCVDVLRRQQWTSLTMQD